MIFLCICRVADWLRALDMKRDAKNSYECSTHLVYESRSSISSSVGNL